jgi:hypothetical protein
MVDAALVAKIVLISYIVISPLFSYKAITFLDTTTIKVLILISIVLISFIDLELAILATIAFLVLLINLYNISCKALHQKGMVSSESKVFKAVVPVESEAVAPSEVMSFPPVVPSEMIPTPSGTPSIMTEFPPQSLFQTPQAYSSDPKYDIVQSENLYEHNIDAKIKPYEAFIQQLSPNESLKLIQTNELI